MFKWSYNRYLVIWLSGYLVIWLSGYLVIWLSGYLVLASNSFALGGSNSGYYAGFMLGPTTSGSSSSSTGNSKTSAGGRLFLGYEANQNFSYEGGLSTYPQSTSSAGCTSENQRKLYFDLVLKASLLFSDTIGIYTKLGPATSIYIPGLDSCNEGTVAKFYPSISVGTSAGLADNSVLDVSWNRLIIGGSTKYIELYAVGLSYHFTG